MGVLTETVNPGTAPSVKIGCSKCFGVLFVGPIVSGKLYCQTCGVWTRAAVSPTKSVGD